MANEWVVRKGLIIRPLGGFTDEILVVDSEGKVISGGTTLTSIVDSISATNSNVASISGDLSNYVLKTGDSMTGQLTIDPSVSSIGLSVFAGSTGDAAIDVHGDLPESILFHGHNSNNDIVFELGTDPLSGSELFLYDNDGVTPRLKVDSLGIETSYDLAVEGEITVIGSIFTDTVLDGNTIHVGEGTSETNPGVHIYGPNKGSADSAGGILFSQGLDSARRLYLTGNDGGYSFSFSSFNSSSGVLQMSNNQVGVAAQLRLGPTGERVVRNTNKTTGSVFRVDTIPPAFAADTDNNGYHTYLRTQDGGPVSSDPNNDGGDFVLILGQATGSGIDGRFIVQGTQRIQDDFYIESLAPSLSGNFLTWDSEGKIVDSGYSSQDISGGGGGSGSVTSLIGGNGISVTESPTDTWTVSVSADYSTKSYVDSLSGSLQTQINNISGSLVETQQGTIICNTTEAVYTINHDEVVISETSPVISLTVPGTGSDLYIQGITNRTTTSFDVVLSSTPAVSGYSINWQMNSGNSSGLVSEFDSISAVNAGVSGSNSSSTALASSVTVPDNFVIDLEGEVHTGDSGSSASWATCTSKIIYERSGSNWIIKGHYRLKDPQTPSYEVGVINTTVSDGASYQIANYIGSGPGITVSINVNDAGSSISLDVNGSSLTSNGRSMAAFTAVNLK